MTEGRKIKAMRPMTQQEFEEEGWDRGTTAIELDDGTVLYPSQDPEGNGPGALFGRTPDGKTFSLYLGFED